MLIDNNLKPILIMKKVFTFCVLVISFQLFFSEVTNAQLLSLPRGDNKRAAVSEQIGITDVTIRYSRPGVRKREGHIWGELIPLGYSQLGYGAKKPAPWRAGANENTTIEFSTDVKINGKDLPAGIYGFFCAYGPDECTLIFSKNSTSWGNFFYDPAEDALQVKVKPIKTEKSIERLKYEFDDQTLSGATVLLQWEKLTIPFKIEVDVIKTQIASFRKELRGSKSLPGSWQPWYQAAAYCVKNNTNLEQGLMWADSSLSATFGGNKNFDALQTKAAILDSLGRKAEAADIMKTALTYANDIEGYTYGISLILAKRQKEGFDIIKVFYEKYPNSLFTNIGMAAGYSAYGDYKKALPYAQKASLSAKGGNKIEIERNIRDLQNGKDMNN
jgi:hypothetical protein